MAWFTLGSMSALGGLLIIQEADRGGGVGNSKWDRTAKARQLNSRDAEIKMETRQKQWIRLHLVGKRLVCSYCSNFKFKI
jgi:hypothetical protein